MIIKYYLVLYLDELFHFIIIIHNLLKNLIKYFMLHLLITIFLLFNIYLIIMINYLNHNTLILNNAYFQFKHNRYIILYFNFLIISYKIFLIVIFITYNYSLISFIYLILLLLQLI